MMLPEPSAGKLAAVASVTTVPVGRPVVALGSVSLIVALVTSQSPAAIGPFATATVKLMVCPGSTVPGERLMLRSMPLLEQPGGETCATADPVTISTTARRARNGT